MIGEKQIQIALHHPVQDVNGATVGEAKQVFLDSATGKPEWVAVKSGMLGTSESFVPIHDANVVEDHLEVAYSKDKIKNAPKVEVDASGHLSEEEEHRLYRHYGIDWDTAWQQADKPGEAGFSRTGDRSSDDAMTRSEERMRVSTERREVGRARLHKYVVTEDQEQTVPIRKEKPRVMREPITDANVEEAMAGPEISEAEHEVILHEERPVVEKYTEPVERVWLTTEEETEQQTVKGTVRKERIEEETIEDEDRRS